MTVGAYRPLDDAVRIAFTELVHWIHKDYGLSELDAYELLSKVAGFISTKWWIPTTWCWPLWRRDICPRKRSRIECERGRHPASTQPCAESELHGTSQYRSSQGELDIDGAGSACLRRQPGLRLVPRGPQVQHPGLVDGRYGSFRALEEDSSDSK